MTNATTFEALHTDPIEGLFTEHEINLIACSYRTDKAYYFTNAEIDDMSAIVQFAAWSEIEKMGVEIVYTEGQPYETAGEMRLDVSRNKRLLISYDHNNPAVWSPSTNLLFRVAHDLHHCQSSKCNFTFYGEVCACAKFLQYFLHNETYARFIVSEIVGQVAHVRAFGEFPTQRSVLAPVWVLDRIYHAYFVAR